LKKKIFFEIIQIFFVISSKLKIISEKVNQKRNKNLNLNIFSTYFLTYVPVSNL
jgi:hypothetical protein